MSIPSNDHAKAVFKPAVQAISATVLIFALLSAFDMLVLGFNPIRKTAIILDGYYLFRLVLCPIIVQQHISTKDVKETSFSFRGFKTCQR